MFANLSISGHINIHGDETERANHQLSTLLPLFETNDEDGDNKKE